MPSKRTLLSRPFIQRMWKRWQLYCILLHLCVEVSTQRTDLDSPFNIMMLRAFRNWAFDTFEDLSLEDYACATVNERLPGHDESLVFSLEYTRIYEKVQTCYPLLAQEAEFISRNFGRTGKEGGRDLQIARNAQTTQEIVPDYVPFPCNVTGGRSQEVPDSVHRLRPGDIDVIAAMGDSLTAGAGVFANNLFQVLVENRGVTALGGGQGTWRQYLTLPNIIKVKIKPEFNHNLIGYALGDSLTIHEASQLNVAESGAISENMPYMAEVLVKRIKNNPKINVKKHWKFISLMIGANDFCSEICWVPSPWSILEKHKTDILQVLRTLRDNLPRTFVSLIPPPHMKILVDSRKGRESLKCFLTTDVECPCMFGTRYQSSVLEYYIIMRRWQDLDVEISTYPEFQKDDFAVVTQTAMLDLKIPLATDGYTDTTYFSSDCFHLTQKANAQLANSIWNNILEPIDVKTTNWQNLFEKFLCPTPERPYFATLQNSGRNL